MGYDKIKSFGDFLDWYYSGGGMAAMMGNGSIANLLQKADDPYDTGRSDYFDPKYALEIAAWGLRTANFYSTVPKTIYMQKGDSIQVIAADAVSALTAYADETAAIFSGVETDIPDVTDLDKIIPGYVGLPWKVTLHADQQSKWQNAWNMTPEKLRQYHHDGNGRKPGLFLQLLDKLLLQTTDTITANAPDSLDRIISSKAEDDSSWIDAADCDLWNTQGTASIDRSNATTYDAQCDLPSTEVNRALTLDMIDDIMADAKKYGSGNYVAYCNDNTLNALQKLIDPKGRYLYGEKEVELTVNGLKTRKGVDAGRLQVSTIVTNGLTIPVITDANIAVPVAGGAGNLYFVDMEHIELRTSIPITYLQTTTGDMLHIDQMFLRHFLFTGCQLIADQFNCHAAIKCISK